MATVLRQAQGERWRARLPSTGSGGTWRASSLRQAQGERWRARLPSNDGGRDSLRQAPFDRLPSTGSLRQAPFDRLRANDGGRDSHSPLTPHSLVHILSPTAT